MRGLLKIWSKNPLKSWWNFRKILDMSSWGIQSVSTLGFFSPSPGHPTQPCNHNYASKLKVVSFCWQNTCRRIFCSRHCINETFQNLFTILFCLFFSWELRSSNAQHACAHIFPPSLRTPHKQKELNSKKAAKKITHVCQRTVTPVHISEHLEPMGKERDLIRSRFHRFGVENYETEFRREGQSHSMTLHARNCRSKCSN